MERETCMCGHDRDRHEAEGVMLGSECQVEGCDCLDFEAESTVPGRDE